MNKPQRAQPARRTKPSPKAAIVEPLVTKTDRHFVTALARGLEVLASFRHGDRMLGNQELSKRCGLAKSTVSRLTHTLTSLGISDLRRGKRQVQSRHRYLELGQRHAVETGHPASSRIR